LLYKYLVLHIYSVQQKKVHRTDASSSADLLKLRFPGVYRFYGVACINVRTSLRAFDFVSIDDEKFSMM